MTLTSTIARNIKIVRTIRGMNQQQLAKKLSVGKSYMCGVELGRNKINMVLLDKVALALDVSPTALLENKVWEHVK